MKWTTGQLTDSELRKGIAHYESALDQLPEGAPVRADLEDCKQSYQDELTTRIRNRRQALPSSVSSAYPDDAG